jgi:murein DD-endopeptidase MepM/ murein hydrolase activator NlpD
VAFAGETRLGGNTVVIDHGFGLFSVYAHLGEITLEAGMSVTKGMTIGNSDNSGMVIKDGELLFKAAYKNPYPEKKIASITYEKVKDVTITLVD